MQRLKALFAALSLLLTAGILTTGPQAVASSGTPHPGSWHGETLAHGGKDDNAEFVVRGNAMLPETIGPGWSGIIAPTTFKCNEAFLQLSVKRLVIRHGHFSYAGTAVDTSGGKSTGISGRLTWSGTFTATSVKGTVRFQTNLTPVWNAQSYRFSLESKPCDTGTLPWKGDVGRGLG